MKAHLRWNGNLYQAASDPSFKYNAVDVLAQLHDAVWSITPRDAEGWFRHSGYL